MSAVGAITSEADNSPAMRLAYLTKSSETLCLLPFDGSRQQQVEIRVEDDGVGCRPRCHPNRSRPGLLRLLPANETNSMVHPGLADDPRGVDRDYQGLELKFEVKEL